MENSRKVLQKIEIELSFSNSLSDAGMSCFIAHCFIAFCIYSMFYKLKICDNLESSKNIGTIFPTAYVHFMFLCHIFGNSHNISNFFIIIIFDLLWSHDKTLTDKELLLMDEWRKWFVKMEPTSGEDSVKIIKITTKGLEYYINIVDEAVAGFERIEYNFERSSCG